MISNWISNGYIVLRFGQRFSDTLEKDRQIFHENKFIEWQQGKFRNDSFGHLKM